MVSGGSWPVHIALVHSACWFELPSVSLGKNGSWENAEVMVKGSTEGHACLFRTGVVSGIACPSVSGMLHTCVTSFYLFHRCLNCVCLLVSLTISGTKVVGFI